jgi:arylsulfatase A-like enzyme
MFVFLAWQAVHGPWSSPPDDDGLLAPSDPHYSNYCTDHPAPLPDPRPNGLGRTQTMRCQFGSMLKVLDSAMANITDALTRRGHWEQTLMFVTSDNGGVGPGNNWPLRGQKHTAWQGGTRVAAFVTGGYLPSELHGGEFDITIHVADLYATVINRAGGSAEDTVVLQGKPRAVDSIDFWPLLLHSTRPPRDGASPSPPPPLLREYLPTTESSIIWRGRWKLITSAGLGGSYWRPPNGVGPNNSVLLMNRTAWPCTNASATGAGCLVCSPEKPCLFGESTWAAAEPAKMAVGLGC